MSYAIVFSSKTGNTRLLDAAAWMSWDNPEPVHIPTLLEVDY